MHAFLGLSLDVFSKSSTINKMTNKWAIQFWGLVMANLCHLMGGNLILNKINKYLKINGPLNFWGWSWSFFTFLSDGNLIF